MKTPRDLLFTRHQAATPKLDAVRREVVSRLSAANPPNPDTSSVHLLARFWQELILPCRRTWTGLAAVWILILIVHLSQRDTVNSITGKPADPEQMAMLPQAQQRLLNELLADRADPAEADRPRNFSPKPRTEKSAAAVL
jgi:hypothetical protein